MPLSPPTQCPHRPTQQQGRIWVPSSPSANDSTQFWTIEYIYFSEKRKEYYTLFKGQTRRMVSLKRSELYQHRFLIQNKGVCASRSLKFQRPHPGFQGSHKHLFPKDSSPPSGKLFETSEWEPYTGGIPPAWLDL